MRSSGTHCILLVLKIILALLFLFPASPESALAQTRKLSGMVIQAPEIIAISNAHVINLTSVQGTSTAMDGSFSIDIQPGDTLFFQAIGYSGDTVLISPEVYNDNDPLTVLLYSQLYEISGVEVSPLPSYAEFKRAFISFKDSAPDLSLVLRGLPNLPPRDNPLTSNILNPISYFYDRYSKRGKELKKYREVIEKEKLAFRSGWTFDHDMVRIITGLEDEEAIFDFLAYCNFSNDYLLSMKEIEVYEELIACYEKYIGNKMEGYYKNED